MGRRPGELSDLDFDFAGYAAATSSGCARPPATASSSACSRRRGRRRWSAPREVPIARAGLIIGGGVGGAAIAYHLAQLGERDVVLLDRNELTSGSTFHSAGLVGQLRSSVSLTRMMMDSVELYRQLDCGWVQCGGIRLACTPEREEEVLRQVAWARTFGLPLELISAEQAEELFPLMDTEGVRCGSYLATDGYLDPSLLTTRSPTGRGGAARDLHAHARDGIDVAEDARAGRGAAFRRSGVRSRRRSWSTPAACSPRRSGGWPGCACPIVPFAHEYLVTQPFRERGAPGEIVHLPTLRDPDLLIYFREEGGGLIMGGYERSSRAVGARRARGRCDSAGLQRSPAGRGLAALRGDRPELAPARAGDGRDHRDEADQRARGVHARQRVLSGRERGPRLLRGGGLLRARARRGRRDRQGDGRVDRCGRAGERSLGDGHPALRAAVPLALIHAQAHARGL